MCVQHVLIAWLEDGSEWPGTVKQDTDIEELILWIWAKHLHWRELVVDASSGKGRGCLAAVAADQKLAMSEYKMLNARRKLDEVQWSRRIHAGSLWRAEHGAPGPTANICGYVDSTTMHACCIGGTSASKPQAVICLLPARAAGAFIAQIFAKDFVLSRSLEECPLLWCLHPSLAVFFFSHFFSVFIPFLLQNSW